MNRLGYKDRYSKKYEGSIHIGVVDPRYISIVNNEKNVEIAAKAIIELMIIDYNNMPPSTEDND